MTCVVVRKVGPMGDERLVAPTGCEDFDKASVEAWYWLCACTARTEFKLRREMHETAAQIEILARVLANTHGMAGAYWIVAAREIVKTGWRVRS